MKRMTIKAKFTLWVTVFTVILCGLVFGFIALLSNTRTAADVENALITLVADNLEQVEYEDGQLEIDEDFIINKNNMACFLFTQKGQNLSGNSSYNAVNSAEFADHRLQTVTNNDQKYLVYDRKLVLGNDITLWIRGVTRQDHQTLNTAAITRAALIAAPLLIALAALGGYFLSRRLLYPIRKISTAAEEIGQGADLSRRIDLPERGDELNQLAGTFNHMFARLERSFAGERQFTADASHELRTPLAVIKANCEYALEQAGSEDELYEALAAIEKQSARMERLVESLLSFTRLEQQSDRQNFKPTDISVLTKNICLEQRALAPNGMTLTDDITVGIVLAADPELFTRMLVNLIQNAYKYGRENGRVTVSLTLADQPVLAVADDGIGIAPEDLPHICNRFYRVDKARSKSNRAGLGLGLAMVKQIAALHDARLEVESTPGVGSTFLIKF